MKITAFEATNFKRLKNIKLAPDADRAVVLIGGKNAQGKSSLLDALTAAFGGKNALPADPVRHGEETAEIRVELDGGAIKIRRVVRNDGESYLEVREDGGKVRSPQQALDALVGRRFLDPLAFLAMPAKEQRATLLSLVAEAERLAELDRKRIKAFDMRTEVGRDLRRAQAELERLPEVTPAAPIDVAALSQESRQLEEALRSAARARADADKARAIRERTEQDIAGLKAEIDRLQKKLADAEATLVRDREREAEAKAVADNVPAAAGADQRRDEILAELGRAQEHNRKVAADQATAARRAEAAKEVETLAAKQKELTDTIAKIDGRKAEVLANAKLPVPGLGVDDDGVTLNGVPLAQASGAERLRVSLGLAIAAAPGLHDVWIRDGALLDDESLALVAEQATAAGVRVWIERVGTRDPGAVIIHDGGVVS